MIIRKAQKKDLEILTNFSVKLLKYHEKLDPYYKTTKKLKNELFNELRKALYSPKSITLVAEENNEIIGYTNALITSRAPFFVIQKIGLIDAIYVTEKSRNQGVAKLFLDELFKWFKSKQIEYVELKVHENNKIAKNTWSKYGFKDYSHQRIKRI